MPAANHGPATPTPRPEPETEPVTEALTRARSRRALRVASRVVPVLGIAVAVTTWSHLPRMRVEPALLGLVCWTVGNYLFCPLRWRSVSSRGHRRRWYARVYAEGELLGMLTPAHSGAYLWRLRQLTRDHNPDRGSAVVEIGADRLASAAMIAAFASLAGLTLPPRLLPDALLGVGVLAVAVWLTRRWWRPRLAVTERPSPRALLRATLMSAAFQLGYLGFVAGLIAAVGHHVDLLGTASVLGLSQVAGLLPGIHGAGPKEGALTGGLVALGMPLTAALSAVAIGAALAWLPALVVGGGGLGWRAVSHLRARRPGH